MNADHREAVEAARRIVEAAERRSANISPGTSLTAFSDACKDLYGNATVENTIAMARTVLSLSDRVEEARKEERERCAKIADEVVCECKGFIERYGLQTDDSTLDEIARRYVRLEIAQVIAAAIRS